MKSDDKSNHRIFHTRVILNCLLYTMHTVFSMMSQCCSVKHQKDYMCDCMRFLIFPEISKIPSSIKLTEQGTKRN